MITNGHAARMRFSRFKSAQEGTQSKPRKPRAPRDPAVPRGSKARAAAKKSKFEKDKKKEKSEPYTPPATPIKSDSDQMALDTIPESGMERQRPLPSEPACFSIKPDPDMEDEVAHEIRFFKAEPDVASEISLESADFGQAVDMLGQVNIDNFSRPHIVYHGPSTHAMPEMMASRGMMAPEMCPPSPESLHRARLTTELLAPRPVRRLGLPDRGLFHQHYSNGMPVSVPRSGMGGGKDLGGFEGYMSGNRSAGEMVLDEEGEMVVKEEQKWDDSY